MRTTVYIDGHNLYHGCFGKDKEPSYKWLDLFEFCQQIIGPKYNVDAIKYFTAIVQNRPNDPHASLRQMTYFRAMEHSYPDSFELIYGNFTSNPKRMPLANPPPNSPKTVEVIKTEEKGTDVNLSVHLLNDAWLDKYDCGVVVSNDADMAEAMRLVRAHQGKVIGLINPIYKSKPLKKLADQADFFRNVRLGNLKRSQLPPKIPGTKIQKPKSW